MWMSSALLATTGSGFSGPPQALSDNASTRPRSPKTCARKIRHPGRYVLEIVQPGRVVDQNLAANRSAAGPERQLVQRQAVVDIEKRRHCIELPAGNCVMRVRPVGTPEDALRVGGDQRPGQRRHVAVGWRL